MGTQEERTADDWWGSLSASRRVQVHRWVAQRGAMPSTPDDPDAYDNLIELPVRKARSRAASARYGRPCRTCGAGSDDPCRTRTSGRVTDTHAARLKVSA